MTYFQVSKNDVNLEFDNMIYPHRFSSISTGPWLALVKSWARFRLFIVRNGVVSSFSGSHYPEYPWNEVGTVCDVGASIGTFSIPLVKLHQHLKITNQDLEGVMKKAKDVSPGVSNWTCCG